MTAFAEREGVPEVARVKALITPGFPAVVLLPRGLPGGTFIGPGGGNDLKGGPISARPGTMALCCAAAAPEPVPAASASTIIDWCTASEPMLVLVLIMVNELALPVLMDSGEEPVVSAGAAGVPPDDALSTIDPVSDIASCGGRSTARQRLELTAFITCRMSEVRKSTIKSNG